MDENSLPEENRETEENKIKKEAVPPTVEYLPDLPEEPEDEAETTGEAQTLPDASPDISGESIGEKLPSTKPGYADVKPLKKKEKRGVSPFLFVFILLLAILATFMFTYVTLNKSYSKLFTDYQLAVSEQYGDLTKIFAKVGAVDSDIREQYLYDIDAETLEDSIMRGYLYGIGDKYAEYFNKEQMEELIADSNAEMQGIGITVVYNSELGVIEVATVYPDSPAEKAGLLPGDLIAYIKEDGDYIPVTDYGYTVALNKLRGDAGTKAEFGAFRGDDFTTMLDFSIERGFITEITVTGEMSTTDPKAGIIRISSFDSKTPEQFKEALDSLIDKGAEKLVFDVRNNPGGELDSICAVLDTLLPEGPVIRTVDKAGNEEVVYTSDKEEITLPMAVITNGSTASAAELFTSALRDYEKATLVGEKTYGKGSMQTIQTFADGTGYKYTYRYYCPPFSDNYDGVGIAPDVEIELSEEAQKKNIYLLGENEDDQLLAALETFEK